MTYPQTLHKAHEKIAQLEDTIEQLRAELEYAKTDETEIHRFVKDPNRLKYGLSEREAELFNLLELGKVVSCAWLEDELGDVSNKYLTTLIALVRRKVKPHGLEIVNHRGCGYELKRA